ncbi:MAG: hypothetical protein C0P75_008705 [Bacilli bacterium]|jgi:hypothetical protein|uniref:hypothetical protein n=1 Tax=unclassified Ureibacillus TaxID=2638520 RepID=UPI003158FB88
MNYLKLLMALIFCFALICTSGHIAFADDDFGEHHEHYEWGYGKKEHIDDRYEDAGEMIGWGTVITFAVAGLIFPMRRLTKPMITTFPSIKQIYISLTKFLGKYHILIGIVTVLLSICHGILMYLHEGRLEDEGVSGLVSAIVLGIAGLIGLMLFNNKKVKSLRTTHMTLIAVTMVIALFHIFIS